MKNLKNEFEKSLATVDWNDDVCYYIEGLTNEVKVWAEDNLTEVKNLVNSNLNGEQVDKIEFGQDEENAWTMVVWTELTEEAKMRGELLWELKQYEKELAKQVKEAEKEQEKEVAEAVKEWEKEVAEVVKEEEAEHNLQALAKEAEYHENERLYNEFAELAEDGELDEDEEHFTIWGITNEVKDWVEADDYDARQILDDAVHTDEGFQVVGWRWESNGDNYWVLTAELEY